MSQVSVPSSHVGTAVLETSDFAARTELLSIPTTHAGQLASEENPNQVQKLLDAAISNALNKLANYDAGKFVEEYIQEHGAEIRSATEIDGEPVGGSTPHSAI